MFVLILRQSPQYYTIIIVRFKYEKKDQDNRVKVLLKIY